MGTRTAILDIRAWERVREGPKLRYRKVQYSLLCYCTCAELNANKHDSHFVDTNSQFILKLFIEFPLFVTQQTVK